MGGSRIWGRPAGRVSEEDVSCESSEGAGGADVGYGEEIYAREFACTSALKGEQGGTALPARPSPGPPRRPTPK